MTATTIYFDKIVRETDQAILLSVETDWADHETGGDATASREFWLPLSQIILRPDAKAVDLPMWLAREKGVADLSIGEG